MITLNEKGQPISYSGENAVDAFRIRTLSSALKLLSVGITPTRGLTMTRALGMATQYTGQKYKRTEVQRARDDLEKILAIRIQHIEIREAV